VIDDGNSVGRIKRIMSIFAFRGDDQFLRTNIRTRSDLEPAGCLGDLGWYCIRFILWAQRWHLPREVVGRILSESDAGRGSAPVPMDFSAELIFDHGASAGFYSSFLTQFQQWADISGTKGYLRVADFVHTHNDLESSFEVNHRVVQVKEELDGREKPDVVAQQTRLFRNFSNLVLSGRLDESWPEMALKTQRVMDACLESARTGSRAVAVKQERRQGERTREPHSI
jgi:predicted dehydrogenase